MFRTLNFRNLWLLNPTPYIHNKSDKCPTSFVLFADLLFAICISDWLSLWFFNFFLHMAHINNIIWRWHINFYGKVPSERWNVQGILMLLSYVGSSAVPRYFFSTGTAITLEKEYRYRSAGTFVSQFLGGTRYFCKIFCNKKIIIKKRKVCTIAPVHLPQQSFERFVFRIQCCQPVKCGNRKILFPGKDFLKQKRSGLSDYHFQML